MIQRDLIKFLCWIKCADSMVPSISRKCAQTQLFRILHTVYSLFDLKSSYLSCSVLKKRATVLTLLHRSHKSKLTWQPSQHPSSQSVFRGFSFPSKRRL